MSGETFRYLGRQYRLKLERTGDADARVRVAVGRLIVPVASRGGMPADARDRLVSINRSLLPESRLDVDVRGIDELGQGCRIHFTARPELHVASALARSLEQPSRVLQQRTKEEADVDVISFARAIGTTTRKGVIKNRQRGPGTGS